MEDQNAVETDSYGSAVGTEDSASVGVKEYLQKLKLIKLKYQDICHDLVMEENMNIMNATAEVIGSDDFRRMSYNSQTNMLSTRIIDIRDEYRHVMNLLKL